MEESKVKAIGIVGGIGLGVSIETMKHIETMEEAGRQVIVINDNHVIHNSSEMSDEEALEKSLNMANRPGLSIERPSNVHILEMIPHFDYQYRPTPQKSDNQPWAKRGKHCKGYRK